MIVGDGGKGRVLGIDSLVIVWLFKLKNVLLIEGLTVDLISVSQLFDKDLLVQFTKDKCIIRNQNHCHIIEGERTLDNYYILTSTGIFINKMLQDLGVWVQ